MDEIRIVYIEGKNGRLTYGVEWTTGDVEAYERFLKDRNLRDIDGKTCTPIEAPEK